MASAAATKTGHLQQPDLTKYYGKTEVPLQLESQEFRAFLLRPGEPRQRVDGLAEAINWRSEPGDPVLHGDVTFRTSELPLRDGYRLRLQVHWFGNWTDVWVMRMYEPDDSIDPIASSRTMDLHDDGYLLQTSRDDFHFTKNKAHPHGWYCHEIVIWIARRYRLPLGKIAKGKHRIKHLTMQNASPMQVLQKAYALERQATGHRFVARFYRGRVEVVPLRRNPMLYTLSDQLTAAAIGKTPRKDGWATAMTVTGSTGQGDSKRKVKTTYYDQRAIAKHGVVMKTMHNDDIDSEAEARDAAKRRIAKQGIRKRTLTVEHLGIAFVRRGDAMRIRLPKYGIKGKHSIAFVTASTHSLRGADFTMRLEFTFDDPYVSPKQRRRDKDKKTREEKRDGRT